MTTSRFDEDRKQKIKRIATVVVGAAVVGLVGYGYAAWTTAPKMVALSQIGCGIPATALAFGVPLETIARGAPAVPASYGPLELPANATLRLTFDPTADGKGREIALRSDTLYLPMTFGRNDARPDRIRVTCREGLIATVRYESGTRDSTTFNVVYQEISELAPEDEAAAEPVAN